MKNWKKAIVGPDETLRTTLKVINDEALKIALVVDENGTFMGTITDGDVRRGILRGIGLDDPILPLMNSNPLVVKNTDSKGLILDLMKSRQIQQIPVIDDAGRLVGVEIFDFLLEQHKKENIVILMAGGEGNRLRPLTHDCPKPLLKVGKRPIIETIIERFVQQGFYKFILTVKYKAEMLENYLGDGKTLGAQIQYVKERESLGTAGALGLISERMTLPTFVMNGDLLTKIDFRELLSFHENSNVSGTMCVREMDFNVPFGIVNTEGNQFLGIEEKPSFRFMINAGIYVLSPQTFSLVPKDECLGMPDFFQILRKQKHELSVFPVMDYWMDIGRLHDFDQANREYAEVFE